MGDGDKVVVVCHVCKKSFTDVGGALAEDKLSNHVRDVHRSDDGD